MYYICARNMSAEQARNFFEKHFGLPAQSWLLLPASGSARKNFIGENAIGKFVITLNENIAENKSFLYFSSVFNDLSLNTPKIFAVHESEELYIQEFLGSRTLSEIIEQNGLSEKVKIFVQKSLEKLFILQKKTAGKIDYGQTFEYEKYDDLPILHDLYYFKNFFADVLEVPYNRSALLKEFKKIISLVENLSPKGIMIRDFQARNIMVNDAGAVSFIDYQTAMEGPLMYDVISFLYQAKANFPEDFREEMLQYYQSFFTEKPVQEQLQNSIQPLKLMRILQVLGAYGFRGLIQRKPHFISSISKALENLSHLSANWKGLEDFPELTALLAQFADEKIQQKIQRWSSQ